MIITCLFFFKKKSEGEKIHSDILLLKAIVSNALLKFQSYKHLSYTHLQMAGSPRSSTLERRVAGGLLFNKLEEVNKSVKVCISYLNRA